MIADPMDNGVGFGYGRGQPSEYFTLRGSGPTGMSP